MLAGERRGEKSVYKGGNSKASGQTERRFKPLRGSSDREHLWTSATVLQKPILQSVFISLSTITLTQTHTQTEHIKKDSAPLPPKKHFKCTKQTQRTSGYWILTMKLQRLHFNGGDEVRSWDGNHKLIPLTWQATRPWLLPNLPPLKSERHLKKEILNL